MDDDWETFAEDDDKQLALPTKPKDSWEDEDLSSSEEETHELSAIEKQKLAEKAAKKEADRKAKEAKEEAERKRILKEEAVRKMLGEDGADEALDDAAKARIRAKRDVETSDLQNAADLFGGLSVVNQQEIATSLDKMKPKTAKEFETFTKMVSDKILSAQRSRFYQQFLEDVFRNVAKELDREDIGRLSSILNTIANDKMRQEKSGTKKKGKGKPQVQSGAAKGGLDTRNYGDGTPSYMDDYDDFM